MILVSMFILSSIIILLFLLKQVISAQVEKNTLELNPENKSLIQEALAIGIQRHTFYSNKRKLFAHWYEHTQNSPSVFIVHGNSESLSDWVKTQHLLNDLAYNSFVFDYTGFGSSEGKPSVKKLRADTQLAWAKFNQLAPENTHKIIVAHSLGVAILLDALPDAHLDAQQIILHGVFSSAREIAIHLGSIKKRWAWLIPDVWNNMINIQKLPSIPCSIFHSQNDQKIPFNMGESVAANNPNVRFIPLRKYGHNAVYENPDVAFWKILLKQRNFK